MGSETTSTNGNDGKTLKDAWDAKERLAVIASGEHGDDAAAELLSISHDVDGIAAAATALDNLISGGVERSARYILESCEETRDLIGRVMADRGAGPKPMTSDARVLHSLICRDFLSEIEGEITSDWWENGGKTD